jgi:hypothetical protein
MDPRPVTVKFGILALAAAALVLCVTPTSKSSTAALPQRLDDRTFWTLVTEFSEPNGFFRSDNLVSNEMVFQYVIPTLQRTQPPMSAYVGVGPDQNFTYIAALKPRISFIVDIRRQNMLEHLLYKAIFELSGDRSDFVSYLFSRPRPKGLTENTDIEEMFNAYDSSPADQSLLESNANAILLHLVETHQFALSEDDQLQIRYILSNFQQAGPDLSYTFLGSYYQGTLGMPTYRQLMQASDAEGYNWGFLANKEQFQRIQDIQRRNLIIPLVGDFAGPKAIKSVADYLRRHKATVGVFYTSNVERYLFQNGVWDEFMANVGALPSDDRSTIVRSCFDTCSSFGESRAVTLLDSMAGLVTDVREGRVGGYRDVLARSRRE